MRLQVQAARSDEVRALAAARHVRALSLLAPHFAGSVMAAAVVALAAARGGWVSVSTGDIVGSLPLFSLLGHAAATLPAAVHGTLAARAAGSALGEYLMPRCEQPSAAPLAARRTSGGAAGGLPLSFGWDDVFDGQRSRPAGGAHGFGGGGAEARGAHAVAVQLRSASFGWGCGAADVLHDISFAVPKVRGMRAGQQRTSMLTKWQCTLHQRY